MDLKTRDDVQRYFKGLGKELGVSITADKFAKELDSRDPLAHFREKFCIPTIEELLDGEDIAPGIDGSSDCHYFLGSSLGLPPKAVHQVMKDHVDKWAKRGHRSRLIRDETQEYIHKELAKIVGAKPIEVVMMNGLSVNIHLGMVTFYKPTASRHKILCEKYPFPSDQYALESQIKWHGYDPKTSLICLPPREGEHVWRTEDILKVIEEEGDSIALVHLPGVHYATGHFFDIKTITEAAHKKGCYVSYDLAHTVGNIELHLHDWDVDVASWCAYKYLNGGSGGLGGLFVHEKHAYNFDLPRFSGWWGNKIETRFDMSHIMDLQPGAGGFQISDPGLIGLMPMIASLNIFKETSMPDLRNKSRLLTGYLEMLLEERNTAQHDGSVAPFKIITSPNPSERGCQLSIAFSIPSKEVHQYITQRGFEVDLRGPLMRVSPVPLYNTFTDVLRLYNVLCEAIDSTVKVDS